MSAITNRGNKYVPVVEAGMKTASDAHDADRNPGYRGVVLMLAVTAKQGTSPTLDLKLQGYNKAADDWYDITGAAFAQVTGSTTLPHRDEVTVYPGIAETANETVSDVLPEKWRVKPTIGGSNTPGFNYAVEACLLL